MAKKRASLGCLFWFALVLLAVVVFLFSRDTVRSVIEKTGFLTALRRQEAEDTSVVVEPIPEESPRSDEGETRVLTVVSPEEQVPPEQKDSIETQPTDARGETGRGDTQTVPATEGGASSATPDPREQKPANTRQGRLYFVQVDENGEIALTGFVRSIPYVDAPLAATLTELLKGPSDAEAAQGYITLVPQGSTIDKLYVEHRTAFISFTEGFRFNPFGYDGLRAQLQQVVYTATDFHNIDDVQILIGGRETDYLGPEGIRIAEPLSKDSFRESHL